MISPLRTWPSGDSLLAAKFETLFACYAEISSIASFWQSERAVLCLFGGRLTVIGEISGEELFSFASMLGAREIEGDARRLPDSPDFVRTEHPVLEYRGGASSADPPAAGDLAEAWEILCDADAAFAEESSRLEWLSDLRRRTGQDRAAVFCESGAAIVVTALSPHTAVIGAVACRREKRGRHAAASLLKKVTSLYAREGRAAVTAAATDPLAGYYARLGFVPAGRLALLTRRGAR